MNFLGNTRCLAQISLGAMPHNKILHAIELLGTKVAPEVRKNSRSVLKELQS